MRTFLLSLCAVSWLLGATAAKVRAAHQTDEISPIVVGGSLPYRLEIVTYDFGATPMPTLQSFAAATHQGRWLLIAGRTQGLHGLGHGGLNSFPPALQNRELWVMDPQAKQSWHRSLEDKAAGLSTAAVDSLSTTNAQFYAWEGKLYMVGGYGFDRETSGFITYDALTAVDLAGIINWVQSGQGTAAQHIRQIHDPLFRVTGGAMLRASRTTHLVFGQDFRGGYNPLRNGVYTKQVRSFAVTDDASGLSVANVIQSPQQEAFRRRDLNVVPRILRAPGSAELAEGLIVLSGVFTPTTGVWTVPVEISDQGTPSMADPTSTDTFKQGMNNYHCAKLSMYSESRHETHVLSFGGISLQYYDRDTNNFVTDDEVPFINQVTAVVVDAAGAYRQHLLPVEFPELYEGGKRLRFGAGAEFLPASGIAAYENGVLKLDEVTERTRLGYIVGGIAADAGNRGNTFASGRVFEVVLTPVPQLLADFDFDGDADGDDFLVWQSGFGKLEGATQADGDANGDAAVNGDDFLIWQAEFGSSVAGMATARAAPAPAAGIMQIGSDWGKVLRNRASRRLRGAPGRLRGLAR